MNRSDKSVLVIGMNGIGLMPTTPRKARILIRQKKAKVVRKMPFTIRLLYKTGSATQHVELGIDTGSQHVGVAVVADNKVLQKSEHVLRSTMEKRVLIEKRKTQRRSRRYRKTEYRHPKFRQHTKYVYAEKTVTRKKHKTHWKKISNRYGTNRKEGWLPPSIQQKIDIHIMIIRRYQEALPLDTSTNIEIARFDIQKINKPDIEGVGYQTGRMYQFENVKAYVLWKYSYRCPVCGTKFGTRRKSDGIMALPELHHKHFRSRGATDNPDEYMPVCTVDHRAAEHGDSGILGKLRKAEEKTIRGQRDMTFMNILRKRMWEAFPSAVFTYGNVTNADRKTIGLSKTHANDAVAIAMHRQILSGMRNIVDAAGTAYYRQVRKKKRSLHEATARKGRARPNTAAKRNAKNTKSLTVKGKKYCLRDKVEYNGQIAWIAGFSGKTGCRIQSIDNKYLSQPGKSYTSINLSDVNVLNHNNNWIVGSIQEKSI